MTEVYVALGSNLATPYKQLKLALLALAKIPSSHLFAASGFYRNAGLGTRGHSDYLNAVVRMRTALPPETFLNRLQAIERHHGRRRVAGRRWDPRQLDLDLLLYGSRQISTRRLKVPHPLMGERDFVLLPMQEIAPDSLHIPGHGSLNVLTRTIDPTRLQRVNHV